MFSHRYLEDEVTKNGAYKKAITWDVGLSDLPAKRHAPDLDLRNAPPMVKSEFYEKKGKSKKDEKP